MYSEKKGKKKKTVQNHLWLNKCIDFTQFTGVPFISLLSYLFVLIFLLRCVSGYLIYLFFLTLLIIKSVQATVRTLK